MREQIRTIIEQRWFSNLIVGLILFNAVTLGFETSPSIMDRYGTLLTTLDSIVLCAFVIEMILKLYAYSSGFFKSGWNILMS